MTNNKKWTKEEDNKVIETVKNHPENLQYCFYLVSRKIDRTPSSIQFRYYNSIRPNLPKEEPIVFTGSPRRIVPNSKVIKRDTKSIRFSILKSKWKKILEIIKN